MRVLVWNIKGRLGGESGQISNYLIVTKIERFLKSL